MKSRFLITGGSGVLGTELQKIEAQYNSIIMAPTSSYLNILDKECVLKFYQENRDRLNGICGVIHCAAYTNVPGSETNKTKAIEINVTGTQNVKRNICWTLGVPMTYISTDYVYPGRTGDYKETDRVEPVNFYAQTKFLGEACLDEDDLIIRTSFKPNAPWPYERAFDDLYTSSDYVDIIAPKIFELVSGGVSGIYNVGTEKKTVYDLARRRNTKIKPMSIMEITDVDLPSDISMNLDKYNKYYDDKL